MSICTERGADRGQPQPIHEQVVAVIYGEDLRLSIRVLLGRPAESLLLAVAVAFAVAATVTGITLAAGAATISERLLASLHHREIVVTTTMGSTTVAAPARLARPDVELSFEDLDRARSVTEAVQYAYMAEDASYYLDAIGDPPPRLEDISVVKVTPEYFAARELAAADGSLFTAADLERGEPVMVVGSELAATLFGDGQALGRELAADFRRFLIIGVLERSRTHADEQAFVPAGFLRENYRLSYEGTHFTTGIVRFGPDRNSLRFTVADRALVGEARAQVARYFDATYGEGVLNITDPRTEARALADRYRRLARVILFLALSALLIATLNMSSIFSSRALRRRRSAGILKAMGAAGTRVFVVFLFDALVVGAVGSAAGVGLAVLVDRLLARGFGLGGLDVGLIAAGVAASWIIVAACSVVPAVAAARPPAAVAIRYE